MERRSFLKFLFGAPVVAAAQSGEGLIGFLVSVWRKVFPKKDKPSSGGMAYPIRRSIDYQSVGRKLLMVEELPQGAFARYERDVKPVARAYFRNRESHKWSRSSAVRARDS